MNRTRRAVARVTRRLRFLVLAPLWGCALNNVHVGPPTTPLTTDASLGRGRVVLIEMPFKDDRPDRTRCGMVKNGYGMDTANVVCVVPPKEFVAEQLVRGLSAAGFSVIDGQSADPLRIEGTLVQFFLEPKVDALTFTPEADVGVHLVATSASGLRAERDFYVKGEELSVIGWESNFQHASDKGTNTIVEAMIVAIAELCDHYPAVALPRTRTSLAVTARPAEGLR